MLTSGRLGTLAGLEPKTLRYYDRVGLVPPTSRTLAGYRVYATETVDRLRFIARAKALGMTLAEIRRILAYRDEGAAPCQHVLELVAHNLAKVDAQIAQLDRLQGDLRRLQRLLKEQVNVDARSAEECACFSLIQRSHEPRASITGRRIRSRQGGRHG